MIPKPISPTELRQKLYSVVREVARGSNRYLITPADDDGVVMLSRQDYNEILAERSLLREIRLAESDIAAGRTQRVEEVRATFRPLSKAVRKSKRKR